MALETVGAETLLGSPLTVGSMNLPNRLVRAATHDGLATHDGQVTPELIERYQALASGGVGLIITGAMSVQAEGRSLLQQVWLESDETVPGLQGLTQEVHALGGRIVFQLNHGGRQGNPRAIGPKPRGPSAAVRDPIYLFMPGALAEEDLEKVIACFGSAARRAAEAGADGIQLHAAHTYLLGQFLSPYFNRRQDGWGGSDEGRFRLVREVFLAVQAAIPAGMPILVKLNGDDYTPSPGVTPALAARYAGWLCELGAAAIEVSAGSAHFSYMNMARGKVPIQGVLQSMPAWQRPIGWLLMKRLEGKYELEEAYNLQAAKEIKQAMGDVPLILLGGMRSRAAMEAVLREGTAQLVALSRPFIRQPKLAQALLSGETDAASCTSCNNCLAAIANSMPIHCYSNGLPCPATGT